MLAASFCFAVMAAAAKSISPSLSAAQIVFVRSLAGSLVLALLMIKTKVSFIGREPKILAARGVVGFTALILYFWTISKIDLGTAVMLNYTAPIFAVIAATLLFKEKTALATKLAICASFIGVYFLITPQLALKPLPLAAGLLSGLLAGIVHVLIRYSHEEEAPLTIIFYFTFVSTIASGLLLLKTGFVMPEPRDWMGLFAVTAFALLGQLGLTHSLRSAAVSVVSPFGYLTPVIGAFLGWWIWREALSPLSLLGSALIVLCGILMYRHLTRQESMLP